MSALEPHDPDMTSECSEVSALSTNWEEEYSLSPVVVDHAVPSSSPIVSHATQEVSTTDLTSPLAEDRWYSVTVGRRPGVIHGSYVVISSVEATGTNK